MARRGSNEEKLQKDGSYLSYTPLRKYLDTIHGIPSPDDRRFVPKVFTIQSGYPNSEPEETPPPIDENFILYEDSDYIEFEFGGLLELE